MDKKYRLLKKKISNRERLHQDIRVLTTYICFYSWEDLMMFMMNALKISSDDEHYHHDYYYQDKIHQLKNAC